MEKKPSERQAHTSEPGELGRLMMKINPGVVAKIVAYNVSRFDPEKLERYNTVMSRRPDGSDTI